MISTQCTVTAFMCLQILRIILTSKFTIIAMVTIILCIILVCILLEIITIPSPASEISPTVPNQTTTLDGLESPPVTTQPARCGLHNLGNTCYFNAVLQVCSFSLDTLPFGLFTACKSLWFLTDFIWNQEELTHCYALSIITSSMV